MNGTIVWFSLLLLGAFGLGYGTAWLRAIRDYRQLAALLLGLRDGDFSLRAAKARGARGESYAAFNALADEMTGNRRAGIESDALLGKLLAALDLAIFVIGSRGTIVGANQAAEALLNTEIEKLIDTPPAAHGIGEWLNLTMPNQFETTLPGGDGPWEVRRLQFRRAGRDHLMLVASDLSRALRSEERRVWRGLIRVLSHETGNSLGPIQAIAETLLSTLDPSAPGHQREGLALIERRARGLAMFIRRYADLARLPPPIFETVPLTPLIRRVAALESRLSVSVDVRQAAILQADPAQLEQALINLIRNAADATLDESVIQCNGTVTIRLSVELNKTIIDIIDDGPGLPKTENLFVPGFTTKKGGSGIGLVLAREVIEAHGGTLTLKVRSDCHGAIARIYLPCLEYR